MPERDAEVAEGHDPGVVAAGRDVLLLGLLDEVVGALLQRLPAPDQVAQVEQAGTYAEHRLGEELGTGLGQALDLAALLERLDVLAAGLAEGAESPQDPEQLGCVADALAQFERPGIGLLGLRRAVAARRVVGGADPHDQGELELPAFPLVGHGRRLGQPPVEVGDGFRIGRTVDGPLAGQEPLVRRRLVHGRLGEVMGDEFRLVDEHVPLLGQGDLGDPGVVVAPGTASGATCRPRPG